MCSKVLVVLAMLAGVAHAGPACDPCDWYLGVEVGAVETADARSPYGNGLGKGIVLGYHHVELRGLERYDLSDRSGMLGGDQGAFGLKARFTVSSLAYRLFLLGGDHADFSASVLLGGAWVRRANILAEPDFGEFKYATQDGLGAVVGAGVQLFGIVRIEVRAYALRWQDLSGDTRAVYADGAMKTEVVTDSPGGLPLTISAGIGYAF